MRQDVSLESALTVVALTVSKSRKMDSISTVFFVSLRAESKTTSLIEKLRRAFKATNPEKIFQKNDIIAIKTHFGEPGNTGFVSPIYFHPLVDELLYLNTKPFLTDSNTLYVGQRANSVDHLKAANRHGFSYSTFQIPTIIADGLLGNDVVEVVVNLKHFKTIPVSSSCYFASSFLVVSHVKGHMGFGFGGALKNVGMGMIGRMGKYRIHSSTKPSQKLENCISCSLCIPVCPGNALSLGSDNIINIDYEKCIGCGACIPACPQHVFRFDWDKASKTMYEKLAEACLGVLKGKKSVFFNFLIDITPDCDCASWSDSPVAKDIGILISRDPVAIDQASLDLLKTTRPLHPSALRDEIKEDPLSNLRPQLHPQTLLDYANFIGLGNKKYQLEEIK